MSSQHAIFIKTLKTEIPDLNLDLKFPLYPFQRKGVLFLYCANKCLLADSTGLGKTIMSLGLFKFIEKINKEPNRWIIVVPANAIYQWQNEFHLFTDYRPFVAIGDRQTRIQNYMGQFWQFMILSYQILLRDWKVINNTKNVNWLFDDAHAFKHHDTKTATIVKHITENSNRVVLTTATPIQKNLMDIHSLFEVLDLNDVFGNEYEFRNKYCIVKRSIFTLRNGRTVRKSTIIGHKNLDQFKEKAYPHYIKRTFKEVGKELPELMVRPIWLGLHESQASFYSQTKKELIKMWDEGIIKNIQTKGFHSVMQILAGTRTAGLKEDESMKLDFVEFFIKEKMEEKDKLVIYSFYKETVKVLLERLSKIGINNVITITGDDTAQKKEAKKTAFTKDPLRKILVGTGAIECALNLQAANYLIMVDLIFNPARVVQLIGRLRRLGSQFKNVVLYILLTKNTIEEKIWNNLKYEQAINDVIFGERSDVFPPLSNEETIGFLRS